MSTRVLLILLIVSSVVSAMPGQGSFGSRKRTWGFQKQKKEGLKLDTSGSGIDLDISGISEESSESLKRKAPDDDLSLEVASKPVEVDNKISKATLYTLVKPIVEYIKGVYASITAPKVYSTHITKWGAMKINSLKVMIVKYIYSLFQDQH